MVPSHQAAAVERHLPTQEAVALLDLTRELVREELAPIASAYEAESMHLRTICGYGWVCTVYEPGSVHDGSEGELYDLGDDPLQRENRWDDPACRNRRAELVALLRNALPERQGDLAPVVANV